MKLTPVDFLSENNIDLASIAKENVADYEEKKRQLTALIEFCKENTLALPALLAGTSAFINVAESYCINPKFAKLQKGAISDLIHNKHFLFFEKHEELAHYAYLIAISEPLTESYDLASAMKIVDGISDVSTYPAFIETLLCSLLANNGQKQVTADAFKVARNGTLTVTLTDFSKLITLLKIMVLTGGISYTDYEHLNTKLNDYSYNHYNEITGRFGYLYSGCDFVGNNYTVKFFKNGSKKITFNALDKNFAEKLVSDCRLYSDIDNVA